MTCRMFILGRDIGWGCRCATSCHNVLSESFLIFVRYHFFYISWGIENYFPALCGTFISDAIFYVGCHGVVVFTSEVQILEMHLPCLGASFSLPGKKIAPEIPLPHSLGK